MSTNTDLLKDIGEHKNNKCLIIKYSAEMSNGDEHERCFVLNKLYSKKFKINPINEITISYPTSGGYDSDETIAKLYFVETISKNTYNEIIRLSLADDENPDEVINLLNA
jgi:hypothetical protein